MLWNRRTWLSVITLALMLVCCCLGCETRVVREKSYYPGQFQEYGHRRAEPDDSVDAGFTVKTSKKKKFDPLGDFFGGLASLFNHDKKEVKTITAEELKQMQAERDKAKQTKKSQEAPPEASPETPPDSRRDGKRAEQ